MFDRHHDNWQDKFAQQNYKWVLQLSEFKMRTTELMYTFNLRESVQLTEWCFH